MCKPVSKFGSLEQKIIIGSALVGMETIKSVVKTAQNKKERFKKILKNNCNYPIRLRNAEI